jgi:hypothetical protein
MTFPYWRSPGARAWPLLLALKDIGIYVTLFALGHSTAGGTAWLSFGRR